MSIECRLQPTQLSMKLACRLPGRMLLLIRAALQDMPDLVEIGHDIGTIRMTCAGRCECRSSCVKTLAEVLRQQVCPSLAQTDACMRTPRLVNRSTRLVDQLNRMVDEKTRHRSQLISSTDFPVILDDKMARTGPDLKRDKATPITRLSLP